MTLIARDKLGPYEILSPLGAGGMGEVYRARDTRLERDVAIKVLPDSMARDKERLLRFEREAKVLATLNHTNIAAVYGFEEFDGKRLLVMELAEGETLADRLKRGPLSVADSIELACGIAIALEAAHEKGIIHRDLKPANIKITPEGLVKILDFGLAKALSNDSGGSDIANSPTITLEHTRSGVILGTAAYMSPEQARGRSMDKRTDIWSFGCVLYECLTGRRPFQGETGSDLIAKILERDPDWSKIPAGTPPLVSLLLRRCLAKDRHKRLRDIGDARVELDAAQTDPNSSGLILAEAALAAHRPRRRGLVTAIAVALFAAVCALIEWGFRSPTAESQASSVYRFAVEIPSGHTLSDRGEDKVSAIAISPDGSVLAFSAQFDGVSRIFVRELAAAEPRALPGTEGGDDPFFSADGRWVAFQAHGKIKKVPINGGPAITVGDSTGSKGVWLADGSFVFPSLRGQGLARVDGQTGRLTILAQAGITKRTTGGEQPLLGFQTVTAVPGSDYVIAGIWDGDSSEDYATVVVSLNDGSVRPILQNAVDAHYVEPGYLVFLRGASVLAVRFDSKQAAVIGDPVLVVDGVVSSKWADEGQFAASLSGTLIYISGGRRGPGRRLIRVDGAGELAALMEGTDAIVGGLELSPDGKQLTLITLRRSIELWAFDLGRRSLSLVNGVGETWSPVWWPDQASVLFQQVIPEQYRGLVRKRIDGSGAAEPFGLKDSEYLAPSSFSPDGQLLLLTTEAGPSKSDTDVLLHRVDQPGSVEVVVGGPANESSAAFAPDGKHFAYVSDETGRYEVFVRAMEEGSAKWQVSQGGGGMPRWSRDGKRLYYIGRDSFLFAVDVDLQTREISSPNRLFDINSVATTDLWGAYDVLPDGGFIMVQPAEWEMRPVRINVVVNWIAELNRR